jgi:hypothetical protein
MRGFRPVIHAREGFMLGIRNPFDGPVFETREDAIQWCVQIMVQHFDRGMGMSDARIEKFSGMVSGLPGS